MVIGQGLLCWYFVPPVPVLCSTYQFVTCTTYQFVMIYWVRTVSDSIIRLFGVSFITDVSKSRTMRSTVQTLIYKCFRHFNLSSQKAHDGNTSDLCVKGIKLKLIGAFEGLCIHLCKVQDPVITNPITPRPAQM